MNHFLDKIQTKRYLILNYGKNKMLSSEEENVLEKNLVWIFSDRRSGSTWLGHELLSYETRYMDEPNIGYHLGMVQAFSGGTLKIIDAEKPRPDYFFSEAFQKTWKLFLKKLILNRIHSQFNDLTHKIIIKEPTGSMGADVIADCLPESKIIIQLRDGRDVMDSKMNALKADGWEVKRGHAVLTEDKRMEFIQTRGRYWVKLMEVLMSTYKNHKEKLRIMVKYEDLLNNTFENTKKIYDFLEIKIDDEELKKIIDKFAFSKIPSNEKGDGKFRRFAKSNIWKENFNDEEKLVLEKIMGKTLHEMGYD